MRSTRLWVGLTAIILAIFAALAAHDPGSGFEHLPRDLRPFRPLVVRALNLVLPRTSFDAQAIMRAASARAGLSDFGADSDPHYAVFVEGLQRLCDSYEREAELTPVGSVLVYEQLMATLANRLALVEYARAHGARAFEDPVFVTGVPRSGTTFLYNLLGLDDTLRGITNWEIQRPLPLTNPRDLTNPKLWYKLMFVIPAMKVFTWLAPNVAAAHPIGPWVLEECMPVLAMSGVSLHFNTLANVSSYNEWQMQHTHTGTFHMHKLLLGALSDAWGRAEANTRFLLKAPWHLYHLDVLLKVYPNAKIIITHREPAQMLASLSSLHARLYGVSSDVLNLRAIGETQQAQWIKVFERYRGYRDDLPSESVLNLSFEEISSNPMSTVAKVYAFLGRSNIPTQKMTRWLQHDEALGKKGASGKHVYEAQWFGLTHTHAFDWYREWSAKTFKS